jgi:hypothetical protein
MRKFGVQYKVNEWRLFTDFQRSIKAVLSHNGNNYASLPIGHSVHLKQSCEKSWTGPHKERINSSWLYDLWRSESVVQYPCFMCEWDSRARSQHWEQKHWTPRTSLEPGSKNIRKDLVDPKKIPLPPHHLKLSIMKQFFKALPKTGNCFKYFCKTFPHLSEAKLEEGVFVGPDIRKLTFD